MRLPSASIQPGSGESCHEMRPIFHASSSTPSALRSTVPSAAMPSSASRRVRPEPHVPSSPMETITTSSSGRAVTESHSPILTSGCCGVWRVGRALTSEVSLRVFSEAASAEAPAFAEGSGAIPAGEPGVSPASKEAPDTFSGTVPASLCSPLLSVSGPLPDPARASSRSWDISISRDPIPPVRSASTGSCSACSRASAEDSLRSSAAISSVL